jgi:hypothetical protein
MLESVTREVNQKLRRDTTAGVTYREKPYRNVVFSVKGILKWTFG